MSISDTSLYYPFIRIPQPTLVHSLLFKDRIKRIIPPHHELDDDRLRSAMHPNKVCKQYLGYDFIENADYRQARSEIAEMFCDFLDEAHSTKAPKHFEALLGENYKNTLVYSPHTFSHGTQYFVYAHKFDQRVFEKLESLKWMRFHREKNACEMRNELCNLYMTILATCISKQTGEPVSTGVQQAEGLLRQPAFWKHFRDAVPPQIAGRNKTAELCVNLLLTNGENSDDAPAIHEILSFEEAARIRSGLEDHRRHFSDLVDHLIKKSEAVNPVDEDSFLSLEVKEVLTGAEEYLRQIKAESTRQLASNRKQAVEKFRSGFSAVVPLVGVAADALTGATAPPGIWTTTGSILGVGVLYSSHRNTTPAVQEFISTRQHAYLFMNRLWDIKMARAETV